MLYSGNAAFFYGVYVESALLCFAAEAYSEMKESLQGIDLISARKRNNLLRTVGDSKGSVTKVSNQIWKMIKVEIIRIAMNEAEQKLLDPYIDGERVAGNSKVPGSWEEVESTFELRTGYGDFEGMETMLVRKQASLHNLLADFELALPALKPYSLEDDSKYDPHTLTPISLPMYQTGEPATRQWYPKAYTPYGYDRGPIYGALRFSHNFFDLPSDANERIRNFLVLFGLESMDPKCKTAYPPRQKETVIPQPKKEKKSRKATHKSRCCSNEIEPHWHLGISASHDDDLSPY